ncbi:hypothetical protein OS493_029354 [Desmophyllum pertusum]|uniref:Uncharacterized protein n=1 Tax=Desmophyllum pertusum TaxID=174260 RepID=A0A9W9Z9J2_9CNID|nr:hypothetical protein OS493_029354 [Desmophyllum pertusum]
MKTPFVDLEDEDDIENDLEKEKTLEDENEETGNNIEEIEDEDEEVEGDKGSEWKISKMVAGRMTYIHIKRALKLILPREYIARCRQKRHWAAKYLPGKAPLDPTHDIVKFSNVALKSTLKGQKVFDIARVEGIQSSKDGSHVTSFKLKGDSTTRVRFSLYHRSSADDTFNVHPALGLTQWRASSSILGAVELLPVTGDIPGCYKLHEDAIAFFKAGDDISSQSRHHSLQQSSDVKRKSTGQQSISKFFVPLNGKRPPDHFQQPILGKVKCHHLWDPEVVKQFADDRQIRRYTAKSLFLQQVKSGEICCFQTMSGHECCQEYKDWREKHPIDAKDLIDKASNSFRSIYIPTKCDINIYGQCVQVDGSIKSVDPPCTGEAVANGESPFTCMNCAKQSRDLKDILRHREKGSLEGIKDRIGMCGFNQRYARTLEMKSALKTETSRRKEAEKQVMELTRVKLSGGEWERCLMDSCLSYDEEKLIVDLIRLFKMGVSKTKPVQMMVIRNLTSKLSKGNNHHYLELVKDISSLFRNELGFTNYSLLADMFGLARNTTAINHSREYRLDAGINKNVLDKAAAHYKGLPVNEASDGREA